MNERIPSRWRALWVLPPTAAGALILIFLLWTDPGPTQIENVEHARKVRVIAVPQVALTRTWRLMAARSRRGSGPR